MTWIYGGVAVLTIAVGLALGGLALSEQGAPGPERRDVSHRAIALGAAVSDPAKEDETLDRFAAAAREPALVMWYQSWNEPLFYPVQFSAVEARGAVPLVTWLPDSRDGAVIDIRDIPRGRYDDYLAANADRARAYGRRFFVRFAHEMNGGWYSWGDGVKGNTPEDYIAAWRHVVRLFRSRGATNVKWVWSPNAYNRPGQGVAAFRKFFPGNRWIDWVALDGYNWGPVRESGHRDFTEVFGNSYDAAARLTPKPLMIAETGSAGSGTERADWIRDTFLNALPRRFGRVRALVWFELDRETDWRVTSHPLAAEAMRSVARRPRYGLSGPALIGDSRWLRPVP